MSIFALDLSQKRMEQSVWGSQPHPFPSQTQSAIKIGRPVAFASDMGFERWPVAVRSSWRALQGLHRLVAAELCLLHRRFGGAVRSERRLHEA